MIVDPSEKANYKDIYDDIKLKKNHLIDKTT